MKKAICLTAALLLLCFAVPATAESAGYPTVAVSFLPIGIFADNVLKGTDAEIILLAPEASGCLHDYQLLPGDLTRLSSADILLINGAGMESFLPDIRDVYPDLMIADCSEGIELMQDESDEGEYNSHIWLSPRNAEIMVRNIADALAEIDSAHAEEYSANADAYIRELQSLDAELKARCERLSRRDIVTFHEAFPYFARDYGLNVLAVIAPEPDEGGSPPPACVAHGPDPSAWQSPALHRGAIPFRSRPRPVQGNRIQSVRA